MPAPESPEPDPLAALVPGSLEQEKHEAPKMAAEMSLAQWIRMAVAS
ncbi:MAG: hypothetical protein M3O50_02610 [Myxococcota bacterium]|nr:hypothetical protein [Myxococcota bacterium]